MSEIELTAFNNGLVVIAGLTFLIATYTFIYYTLKNGRNKKK